MRATVHVIPCAGILRAASEAPQHRGSGIATQALRTAERLEQPADLVLLAVPAGQGQDVADRLTGADRGPAPRKPPARYLGESEEDYAEAMGARGSTAMPAHGRNRRAPFSG